jgi:hypothetical protein
MCLLWSTNWVFISQKTTLGCVRRKFWSSHREGCMWSIQSNVEFGYQLSICSGTKENHGKPWSSWPVAGPSGCKLTSSQQSGTEHANPSISPWLCRYFNEVFMVTIFITVFIYVWISTKPSRSYAGFGAYPNIYKNCNKNVTMNTSLK